MPQVLAETEIDPIADQVDAALTAEEEEAAARRFARPERVGDLSDGGMVGGVKMTPMRDGRKQEKGRPAARRGWMWNGTESLLPLAWNPDGTIHDGARRYLLKRHCLCCHTGGFRGQQCPNCVQSNCEQCEGSTDKTKVHRLGSGKVVQGWIIPNFYLRKEEVPFPARFYGSVDCFLEFCIRRGERGFLTEQDMRMHARTRHRMEYLAYQDGLAAARSDEIESLRRRLDAFTSVQGKEEEKSKKTSEHMAAMRAARKNAKPATA